MGMTSVYTARMNLQEHSQLPRKTASFLMDTDQFRFKNILHLNSPGYNYRPEMMFDSEWASEHGQPFLTITPENLEEEALRVIQYFRNMSTHLQFNDTLYFLLGDDFSFRSSEPVYE